MRNSSKWISLALVLVVSATAWADIKVVQQSHRDAFAVMDRTQPAQETERVIWMGDDRLRMEEAGISFIVRLDKQVLYVLNHTRKTVSPIEIPVDVSKLLPPEVNEQMLSMFQVDVNVQPRDETKKVGEWNARRYDVTMVSNMVTVNNTLWVTNDVNIDHAAYQKMFHQIVSLQPGMKDVLEKLRTIDGFVVEEETVTKMKMAADAEMKSIDRTVSVEHTDAPAGLYDPPADYTETEFDLMSAMQGR